MSEKTEKKIFMLLGLAALAFLALTGGPVPAALTGLVKNDTGNTVNPHGTGAPVNGDGSQT